MSNKIIIDIIYPWVGIEFTIFKNIIYRHFHDDSFLSVKSLISRSLCWLFKCYPYLWIKSFWDTSWYL